MPDGSNGYEAIAADFVAGRTSGGVGADEVRAWAQNLPHESTVLDLGCGSGVPVSEGLVAAGHTVYGIDASARMVEAFRERFPEAPVACEPVETSSFFSRPFDAVVAWGLLFLLPADAQAVVLRRAAAALPAGGRLLFTSPAPACEWLDTMTGRPSVSLGAPTYRSLMAGAGLAVLGEYEDAGDNHYYDARKR